MVFLGCLQPVALRRVVRNTPYKQCNVTEPCEVVSLGSNGFVAAIHSIEEGTTQFLDR